MFNIISLLKAGHKCINIYVLGNEPGS